MTYQPPDDDHFPDFPALSRCMLVDSSFRSRREVIKDIKASALFEEIIEAKSLEDGVTKLRGMHYDACFIGPSIHLESTPKFIERARANAKSDDCAYILIYRPLLETTSLVSGTEAHAAVASNVSKRVFTEATICGVLRANKGSPWPGVRLDEAGNILMEENGEWRVISSGAPALPVNPVVSARRSALESLQQLSREQGAWSESEVVALLRRMLEHPPAEGEDAEEVTTQFLLDALEEWRLDNEYSGARVAAKNLRRKLHGRV